MRKKPRIIISLLFYCCILTLLTFAYAESDPNLYEYELTEKGIRILNYVGDETIVVVPKEIDGYDVVYIGKDAFSNNNNIWCVILPITVQVIENYGFYESSLREIVLPPTLKYIGESAFAYTKLTSVYIPNSVHYLGRAAFYGCYDLRTVIILANITEIKNYMFFECMNLKEVYFPETVYYVSENAFYYCNTLSTIINFEQIKTIYDNSFQDCYLLNDDIVKHFSSIERLPCNY